MYRKYSLNKDRKFLKSLVYLPSIASVSLSSIKVIYFKRGDMQRRFWGQQYLSNIVPTRKNVATMLSAVSRWNYHRCELPPGAAPSTFDSVIAEKFEDEIIRWKELCSHMNIIVERPRRRPLLCNEALRDQLNLKMNRGWSQCFCTVTVYYPSCIPISIH